MVGLVGKQQQNVGLGGWQPARGRLGRCGKHEREHDIGENPNVRAQHDAGARLVLLAFGKGAPPVGCKKIFRHNFFARSGFLAGLQNKTEGELKSMPRFFAPGLEPRPRKRVNSVKVTQSDEEMTRESPKTEIDLLQLCCCMQGEGEVGRLF